jgi:hypothetical protein
VRLHFLVRLAPLAVVSILVATLGCSSDNGQAPSDGQTTDTGDPNVPHALRADVMPILFKNCSSTGCHGSKNFNKGIYVPCCDVAAATALRAALMKDSRLSAGLKLVVPGDPTKSFLMMKLDNTQNDLDAQCNDPDGVLPAKNCGESMPQGMRLSSASRNIVRQWIASGAKDD